MCLFDSSVMASICQNIYTYICGRALVIYDFCRMLWTSAHMREHHHRQAKVQNLYYKCQCEARARKSLSACREFLAKFYTVHMLSTYS